MRSCGSIHPIARGGWSEVRVAGGGLAGVGHRFTKRIHLLHSNQFQALPWLRACIDFTCIRRDGCVPTSDRINEVRA